jgi:hypothetical protein
MGLPGRAGGSACRAERQPQTSTTMPETTPAKNRVWSELHFMRSA